MRHREEEINTDTKTKETKVLGSGGVGGKNVTPKGRGRHEVESMDSAMQSADDRW